MKKPSCAREITPRRALGLIATFRLCMPMHMNILDICSLTANQQLSNRHNVLREVFPIIFWLSVYSTNLMQRRTRLHLWICSWLNNCPKKGVAPVSLTDITKHTHGCTLTRKTGATPPPSAIIKPRENPRAWANATLRVICTVPYLMQ